MRRPIPLLASLLSLFPALAGAETPPPTVLSVSADHAEHCRVYPTSTPDQPFRLLKEPILRRQQNTHGNSLGYTFLWLDDSGRPAALCDIFFFKNHLDTREMLNEWHALTDSALTATGPGANDVERKFLSAPASGLEWKPVPDAPLPGGTARQRELQLRRLAETFSSAVVTSAGERHELRLLSTPIYTFDVPQGRTVLGGGIMAFCVETDPECLLFLEARRVDGQAVWMYAPLATTINPVFVQHDGQQVWGADPPVFAVETPHWKDFIKKVQIPVTPPAASSAR